jgi:hypothetical protein
MCKIIILYYEILVDLLITWLTYKSCIQEHIGSLVDRVNEFPNKLEATDSAEFKQLVGKEYIGVACGSLLFPLELRRKSMEKGLVVVFPSGDRYKVEAPQELNPSTHPSTQELNPSTQLRCGFC